MMRTHNAGELRPENVGEKVVLCGWVASRRDHKGRIFMDLRDRHGRTQCVFSLGGERSDLLERGSVLPLETCVLVRGEAALRPEGLRNPKLATGEVEVLVEEVEILGEALTPPFEIREDTGALEELRMRYRYLDLRRPSQTAMLVDRHRIISSVRRLLDGMGFVDVETPMLTRPTPEGARDYLVPSRERKGAFYALPQSPQLFKQILMVAGLDRYYQVARCFRDEDLRADRQPEFTQIDVEMSFVREDDVIEVIERLGEALLGEFCGGGVERPFPRMTYDAAMARFGTDRPDLRFGLEIRDVTEALAGSEFRAFSETARSGGRIRGIGVDGGAELSRKQISLLEEMARENGAKGLLWLKVGGGGLFSGPAAKFLSEDEGAAIGRAFETREGDLVLLAADREEVVAQALGAVRVAVAGALSRIPEGVWKPLIVTDWPLLEWNEEGQRYDALHHPFTSPREEDLELLESDPGRVRARAYDLVLNGVELGGGSIRNHREAVQVRVLRAIGVGEEEAREKFGFLLEALRYGAPPHGGFALGLDRIVALLLTGRPSIREVMAFPKTTSAACLLTEAPADVSEAQLAELGLSIKDGR